MGERLDAYNERLRLDKEYNDRILAERAAFESQMDEEANEIERFKEEKTKLKEAYAKFSYGVKEALLYEAMYNMYSACLPNNGEGNIVASNLVKNYIRENGVETIFQNMGKTFLNEHVQHTVNKYWKLVTEKVDKEDPATFRMDMNDKMSFLDDLNKESDIENVKQAIALRVSNAEEEFINNNLADKYDMETIVNDTKSRIESTQQDRSTDQETKDAIEQEMTNLSKERIESVREDRPRNVYEQMTRTTFNNLLLTESESLKEQYYTESGKVNVDKMNDSVRTMYGFLETLNTCRWEKIDESYIEKMLKDMK